MSWGSEWGSIPWVSNGEWWEWLRSERKENVTVPRVSLKGDHEQRPAGPELQWLLRRASSLKDNVGIWAIMRAAGDVMDTSATKILCADSCTFLFFHTDKLLYFLFALFLCYLPSKQPYYIFSTPIDLHLSSLLRIARLRWEHFKYSYASYIALTYYIDECCFARYLNLVHCSVSHDWDKCCFASTVRDSLTLIPSSQVQGNLVCTH